MPTEYLSLQELADITWKSLITIRRAVKGNKNIKSKMQDGKLYAYSEDVFQHFNFDYAQHNQKNTHAWWGENHNLATHWLSNEQVDGLLDLSKKVMELTTENIEMSKAITITKEESLLPILGQTWLKMDSSF